MTEVVLADLEIKPITGNSSGHGQAVETDMPIVVRNNQDDASDRATLIVTFPATTYPASSKPSGHLVQPVPPVEDPNVPAGANVIGAMILPLPSIDPGKEVSVAVRFTMTEVGKKIGGVPRLWVPLCMVLVLIAAVAITRVGTMCTDSEQTGPHGRAPARSAGVECGR